MRLFSSIFLSKPVLDQVLQQESGLMEIPGLRWIPKDTLHVTLKFLGEVPEHKVSGIKMAIQNVSSRHNAFEIYCQKGGVFPSRKSPRVFWTAVDGEVDKLRALANDAETEMDGLGFPPENRRFSPHVTLARATADGPFVTASDQFCTLFSTFKSSMFKVSDIHLVQSHLHPSGVRYEVLQSFPLRPR
jgi:RNA 2',3'-cyclic 3'-phosphodiesterase